MKRTKSEITRKIVILKVIETLGVYYKFFLKFLNQLCNEKKFSAYLLTTCFYFEKIVNWSMFKCYSIVKDILKMSICANYSLEQFYFSLYHDF